jgi:hypothetical protein
MEALFEDIVTPDIPGDVDFAALLDLGPLHRAQEYLGLEANPVVMMDDA